MRILAIAVAGWLAGAVVAHADPRGDLQAKGEALAREGHWSEAIEQFKAADKIERRASHACLIALAYTRKEAWPQAELFLALCHERSASTSEALPDWVPVADQQIRERMQAAKLVEVSIEIKPATAAATITVSSFAPDEVFSARTIHLPIGTHVIVARAPGHRDAQQVLQIDNAEARHVVLDLGPGPEATPPPHGNRHPGHPGRSLMIGGGAAVAAGIAAHLWLRAEGSALDDAYNTFDGHAYALHSWRFDVAKYSAVGLYTVGAGLLVTGLIVSLRGRSDHVEVGAAPLAGGGAFVTVGWTR